MLQNQRLVFGVGDNINSLGRGEVEETLECHPQQRLSRAENVKKLLWAVRTARWPESGANTTRHYGYVVH